MRDDENPVLIIGAGVTGLNAALALDDLGVVTFLVEKDVVPGGKVKGYSKIFPSFSDGRKMVKDTLERITASSRIHLQTGVELSRVIRQDGGFQVALTNEQKMDVGAIIISTGFDLFDPIKQAEYGYGVYPDIITSMELEVLLDPNGPTQGRVLRPSDGKPAKRVAIVYCVGSRNMRLGSPYCSRICCSYSTKHAIEIKEMDREASVTCFYMDIRTYVKGSEEMYNYAQEMGVRYVRGRVSECSMDTNGKIQLRAENTLLGKPMRGTFDLVCLAVGMRPCADTESLAKSLDLELDDCGFLSVRDEELFPHESTQPGIFLAGTVTGLKPIRDCLKEGLSVGGKAAAYIRKKGNSHDR